MFPLLEVQPVLQVGSLQGHAEGPPAGGPCQGGSAAASLPQGQICLQQPWSLAAALVTCCSPDHLLQPCHLLQAPDIPTAARAAETAWSGLTCPSSM